MIKMPPDHLPVGSGGGRGLSDPRHVGVGRGGIPNGLWIRASSSSFSLYDRILRPEKEHDKRPERTHPNPLTSSRNTTKGDTVEANGKEREG